MIKVRFGKEIIQECERVLVNLLSLRQNLRRKFIADDVYSKFRVVDIMSGHFSFDRKYVIMYERTELLA